MDADALARRLRAARQPRDSRGRFTRSRTAELTVGERASGSEVMVNFKHRRGLGSAPAAREYLATLAAGRPGEHEAAVADLLNDPAGVNRAARAGQTGDPRVQALDEAMQPLSDDLILTRRIPASALGVVADNPTQLTGMRVSDAGYTIAGLTLPRARAGEVRMRIAVPAGTPAAVDPHTGQVILGRGLALAVSRVEPDGRGGWDAYLVVLPAPKAAKPLNGDAARAAAPVSVARGRVRGEVTKAERSALVGYRGPLYLGINGELRTAKGEIPTQPTHRLVAQHVERMDAVMAKSTLTQAVAVYRGISSGQSVFGREAWLRSLVGATWTEHAYTSTTTSQKIAARFSDTLSDRNGAVIRVLVPPGIGAVELSGGRGGEAELLLQRGLRIRVVRDTGPGRDRLIDVEVIADDAAK